MSNEITDLDRELLAELGVDTTPDKRKKLSTKEERIIAGFEEIERFVEEKGRIPRHGDENDIFERLYAVRLDRLRESEECRALLRPQDRHGLLDAEQSEADQKEVSDEELLAALGVESEPKGDIHRLSHVRPLGEVKAAEEVAQRVLCEDFDQFEPIFEAIQRDLESGRRQTVKYQDNATISQGDLFILDGQKVLVGEMGKPFRSDYGRPDRRLRVIYDNGTESDLLLRSLQRALNKDKASRRITKADLGPLFSQDGADATADEQERDDIPSGTVYVLRSNADHPFIAANRSVIHKIGVTGGDVKARIAAARRDPTYLRADVEIAATFQLNNISRKKLEALLQRVFAEVQLDLELNDRFGTPVKPREWFLVPLEAIEEVVERIQDGTIEQYRYDRESARLIRIDS